MPSSLIQLNQEIVSCTRCSRLITYCQKIGREKRRAYLDWDYWAKPVPGWGDPNARLLILASRPAHMAPTAPDVLSPETAPATLCIRCCTRPASPPSRPAPTAKTVCA